MLAKVKNASGRIGIFIVISGIQIAMHKENKGPNLEEGLIPVEFVSYGVQDIQFTRVFSFIVVKVKISRKNTCLIDLQSPKNVSPRFFI